MGLHFRSDPHSVSVTVSEHLARRRSAHSVAAPCIGRARPHRSSAHLGQCRFSRPTRGGRYSWARYYHPGLERFISEDPIGFAGGDTNLYGYVTNNPTRFRDPYGLFIDPVTTTVGIVTFAALVGIIVGGDQIPAPLTAQKCYSSDQYVVRGGLSAPGTFRVDPIARYQGLYGISSASAPNMTPEQIATISKFPNRMITYTTVGELAARGFPVIPTPDDNPLHADIVVPNSRLTPEQAATLSALFQRNIRPNPTYVKP
jgi:RHS repeat-associated protein